jgi:hypothetical protein
VDRYNTFREHAFVYLALANSTALENKPDRPYGTNETVDYVKAAELN